MTKYLLVNEQIREFSKIDEDIYNQLCDYMCQSNHVYDIIVEEIFDEETLKERLSVLDHLKYNEIYIFGPVGILRTLNLSRIF